MALRAQVHREEPPVALGRVESSRVAICGVSDDVNQVSKTSASAVKPPGWSRCASRVARAARRVIGSTGSAASSATIGGREVGRAVGRHRVPDREGHAEVALPADAPVEVQVLRPVAEAQAHEVGVPGDPLPRLDERLLVLEDPHEPLARGDELERAVALLEELHRVLERLRLGDERRLRRRPSGTSRRGRAAARRCAFCASLTVLPASSRVGLVRRARRRGSGSASLPNSTGARRPSRPDHLAQREALLAPPLHVGRVAERADHQDAGALLAVHELAREDRHRHAEERASPPACRRAAGSARRRGARRRPRTPAAARGASWRSTKLAAALDPEAHVVEGALLRPVLDLGLRHRGLEVHVPQRRRLDLVHLALAVQVEEARLRDAPAALVDRRVLERASPPRGRAAATAP